MGIFRGIGGTGNSTDDGVVDAVTAQAVIATNKATEAATSATSAYNSAQSASTSKDTATTQANAAQSSANTASTQATNASTSATSAATSATSATASATTATTKASEAATSATNAATSETNAATSATTATTKASEAATSATTATTKAGEASTSATNAASSATSASTSASTATTKASEASTSAANAASSYDDFDDRYLGAKSSAPSVDNDGDALITGALYFDTTSNSMKVYSGSAWLDAYASLSGALIATNNLSDLNNAGTARTNLGLGTAATTDASAYATAAQADQTVSLTGAGATSISGTYPNFTITSTDTNTTYSVGDGGLTEINFTSADNTKLDGIEAGATADQTAGEIKTAYESNADTNAFTDADHSKLDGIEAGADVTDTANVTAAGALMDSELTSEASVKALNQGVATTDSPTFGGLTVGDGSGSEQILVDAGAGWADLKLNSDATNGGSIYFNDGADAGQIFYYHPDNTMRFHTDATERMRIDSSGRVGIGTSSPSAKLEIEDTDFARLDLNLSNATGTTIADVRGLVAGTEKWRIGKTASSSDDFTINVTGTERMRIDSSGRVGIGQSTGSGLDANLVVKENDTTAEAAFVQRWRTASGGVLSMYVEDKSVANPTWQIRSGTSEPIKINQASNTRMTIDASGNIGINDTTPQAKLDVNGAVLLQGGTFTAGIDSGTAGIVLQQDKPIFTRDVNGNYLRNLLKHGSGGRIELGQTGTALITGIDLKAGSSGHIKVHSRVTSNNADLELRRNDSSYSFKLATDGSGIIIRHTGNSYNAGFQTRYWYGNTMLSNSGSTGTAYGVLVSSSNLYPAQSGVSGLYRDNAVDLGHSSARWDDVYATNGTIQTSDEREKQDIEALNEAEQRVAVAAKGLLRKFRWKDKVAAKGDDARIHFGIIAQDLEAAFIAEGLDPSKYAMFIKTEWWVGDKVYPAIAEETDEDGNVITEAVEESTDPEHHYDNQADAPADAVYHYRMGIRYSELLAFIISAI